MGCINTKQNNNNDIEMVSLPYIIPPASLDIHEFILFQKSNNYNNINHFFDYNNTKQIDLNKFKTHIILLGL
jgi:hypothetical protein